MRRNAIELGEALISKSMKGFMDGKTSLDAMDQMMDPFIESGMIEEAAKRFADIELEKARPLTFEILTAVTYRINLCTPPDAITAMGGQGGGQFEFIGRLPERSILTTEGVTGRFSKWVTKADALGYLKTAAGREEHLQARYAAWAREAFLTLNPRYDRGDEIAFIDDGDSVWRNTLDPKPENNPYYPGLWHDQGCTGARSMNSAKQGWRRGKRFFFLRGTLNIE